MSRRTSARAGAGTDTWTVETTMFRALAVLRAVLLVNMLALNAYRWDTSIDRPGAAVAISRKNPPSSREF